MGGKNPAVVFSDCYLDDTIASVCMEFFNTGQVCCSGSRLIIHKSIVDKFLTKLKQYIKENWGGDNIGNPLNPQTKMGPLSSKGMITNNTQKKTKQKKQKTKQNKTNVQKQDILAK